MTESTGNTGAQGPGRAAIAVATLIEQTARNIYDARAPSDVHPVQWAAMRFFARANRSARSVAGLARYLGVTLGPASRTVSALRRNGYVDVRKDPRDKRVTIIDLTEQGRELLHNDPIRRLARALEDLPDDQFTQIGSGLAHIATTLDAARAAGQND